MMPKVIGNDSLIARVNEVQGCMYRQSNELGRLNRAVKKYKDENAKLRELLCELYEDQCDDGDRWKYRDRMSKFGIEVD